MGGDLSLWSCDWRSCLEYCHQAAHPQAAAEGEFGACHANIKLLQLSQRACDVLHRFFWLSGIYHLLALESFIFSKFVVGLVQQPGCAGRSVTNLPGRALGQRRARGVSFRQPLPACNYPNLLMGIKTEYNRRTRQPIGAIARRIRPDLSVRQALHRR